MKCSMTCKRFSLLALTLCLALLLAAPAAAEPFLPDGSGDLLLVHGDRLTDEAVGQVEQLVTMASAMGRVTDFGTQSQCAEVLGEYDHVLLYDLDAMDEVFGAALEQADAAVMILGGSTLEQYLTAIGRTGLIRGEEPQKNGTLTYTLSTGRSVTGIVSWERLFSLRTDGYESGAIQTFSGSYPFCSQVAGARFVPVTDLSSPAVRAALTQEIIRWIQPDQENLVNHAGFLVLDSVYPFMSADQLLDIIEQAEEMSVPYVISVMPLSANREYPAMTQFCQVLAYAQSRGAAIILHAPIIRKEAESAQELSEKLTDMMKVYMDNGVYPVGIETPYSWLNREPYLTALEGFGTVLVYEDGTGHGFDIDSHTSLISRQGHRLIYPRIDPNQEGIAQAGVVYADCGSESETFLRYAGAARTAGAAFRDLRDLDHQVRLDDCSLTYQNRTVYVDGVMRDTHFQPKAYDTQFDFHRGALDRMSVDLHNQNQVLLAGVLVLLVIFLSSIVYARHRMRRRFLSEQGGKEESE